jgi:hypothetical protein
MGDFTKGKIYKIYNDTDTYIGSTVQTLNERLISHKSQFKRGLLHGSVCTLLKTDYKIELIEDFPCNTRAELLIRERYWIETIPCVNTTIPHRPKEEAYSIKKERWKNDEEYRLQQKERMKAYEHTDKRKEYNRLKMRRYREAKKIL